MTPEDVERAWEQEERLLTSEVRGDRQALESRLSPDFHEIGQFGRHWHRDDLIAAVAQAASDHAGNQPALGERRADVIGSDHVLLTYRLEFDGRSSRRSSLWRVCGDTLEMVFHQGTPLTS